MKAGKFFEWFYGVTLGVLSIIVVISACTTEESKVHYDVGIALNGSHISEKQEEYTFNDGTFERSKMGLLVEKGVYTANNNKISMQTTHLHGEGLSARGFHEFTPRWYSKEELKAADINGMTDYVLYMAFTEKVHQYSFVNNKLVIDFADRSDTTVFAKSPSRFMRTAGGEARYSVNGRWYTPDVQFAFDNGTFLLTRNGIPYSRGFFITNRGNITLSTTHFFGPQNMWYSRYMIGDMMRNFNMSDDEIERTISQMFTPEAFTYSLTTNTLTLTNSDNKSVIYRKM